MSQVWPAQFSAVLPNWLRKSLDYDRVIALTAVEWWNTVYLHWIFFLGLDRDWKGELRGIPESAPMVYSLPDPHPHSGSLSGAENRILLTM